MKYSAQCMLVVLALVFSQCSTNKKKDSQSNTENTMEGKTIMEVTTFQVNEGVNPDDFEKRDAQIESDFTSKQPGFIKRQSGVNEKGEYVVIVYWKSIPNADASMNKFMSDPSVADYAQMINANTMKMSRYGMDKIFNTNNSHFVEVMSFNLAQETDIVQFNSLNQKVETDFTGKRKGFLQRFTGVNEEGKQVVVVYWTNKEDSDASLDAFMNNPTAKEFMQDMDQSTMVMGRYKFLNMELTNKEKVVALLNSFNTGDKTPISYINSQKYIQHNLSVGDGLAGFGEIMQHAPPQGFKANVVRAFQDGDYVFTHTIYDFFGPKIGFDIFRFEDGLIVEHWDNLVEVQPPNPSDRTQTDGATDITDKEKRESNKTIVTSFVNDVLLNHQNDQITTYINPTKYIQHNPAVADGLEGFGAAMKYFAENGLVMEYNKLHMVLGEGNFVLTVSEGKFGKGAHTAFYDLFRLEDGQIVEHWDVIATIPPKSEWKNQNGKF
ncbi:nuclear transport factor 2 family protein [Aquimarina spongiae]|uniref:Predicted SnoaL-like aldol condensation-catalyzing enzyme n=1 Tax=Aquimarina spongiae TaxID=570521 RepID=A0A1M6CFA9_9FLAO|nr:nuclear transport factor 2 family protein [Aquimarina spongiae]SHI59687.1 Predicted SnoaL-like aldol condensation-catalyzing enzyme [Aquimarina spongiae]